MFDNCHSTTVVLNFLSCIFHLLAVGGLLVLRVPSTHLVAAAVMVFVWRRRNGATVELRVVLSVQTAASRTALTASFDR